MFDLISVPTLLAFVGLVLAIAIAPGPNVLFVMTQSAWRGPKAGLLAAAGVETANSVYVLCSAAGLASLIAASGAAFEIIKWAGAAYLLWLGIGLILRPRQAFEADTATPAGGGLPAALRRGLLTNLLNPKAAMLYLSLLPQFIKPEHGAVLTQSLVLGGSQIVISLTVNGLICLGAGQIAAFLANRPGFALVQRWLMASVLGGLAVRMATEVRR